MPPAEFSPFAWVVPLLWLLWLLVPLGFKLTHHLAWSWWWVLGALWLPWVLALLVGLRERLRKTT